jgi:hypothetical protein
MKLDKPERCRHTQTTMNRSALAVEATTPHAARMLALGLVIFIVVVILPL